MGCRTAHLWGLPDSIAHLFPHLCLILLKETSNSYLGRLSVARSTLPVPPHSNGALKVRDMALLP